jgi:ferredoxin
MFADTVVLSRVLSLLQGIFIRSSELERRLKGCNFCVELALGQFEMLKKIGVVGHASLIEKKELFTFKCFDEAIINDSQKVKVACLVKIIDVKEI